MLHDLPGGHVLEQRTIGALVPQGVHRVRLHGVCQPDSPCCAFLHPADANRSRLRQPRRNLVQFALEGLQLLAVLYRQHDAKRAAVGIVAVCGLSKRIGLEDLYMAVGRQTARAAHHTHDAHRLTILGLHRPAHGFHAPTEVALGKVMADDADLLAVLYVLLRERTAFEELVLVYLEEVGIGVVGDGLDVLLLSLHGTFAIEVRNPPRPCHCERRGAILVVSRWQEPLLECLLAEAIACRAHRLAVLLHLNLNHVQIDRPRAVRLGIDGSEFDVIDHRHHHREGQRHGCSRNVDAREQLFLPHHGESLSEVIHSLVFFSLYRYDVISLLRHPEQSSPYLLQ